MKRFLYVVLCVLVSFPALADNGSQFFVRGDHGFMDSAFGKANLNGATPDAALFQLSARVVADDFVAAHLGATGDEELQVTRVRVSDGRAHVRMQQYLHGLKVVGAEMYVHSDAATGATYLVNGDFVSGANVARPSEAHKRPSFRAFVSTLGPKAEMLEAPELVYVLNDGQAVLVWELRASYMEGQLQQTASVFLNAMSGEEVTRHVTAHTVKVLRTYTANNGFSLPGTLVSSGSTSNTGDSAIDDAHNFAGITYDYFNTKFGRDSLDDNGMTLISSAHYGSNYNNAGWTGSQMVYGDGDGVLFSPLSGDLDVVAHELAHGVTSNESNLIYNKESGALNEAMSDIFGAAAEAWNEGGVNANTWKLGEDIYTPGTSGDALRYMNNPTQDGYSTDYYPTRLYPGACTPNSNTNDNCGVHGNSGIANLAFQLLTDGGSHPQGTTSVVVPAQGLAKAEAIFYEANTNCLTASSNFEAARNCTAQAASTLYGTTEEDAVHLAWDAVGVPGSPGDGGGGVCDPPYSDSLSGLSGSRRSRTFFTQEVPECATSLTISISGGSGDADLYVRFGANPTNNNWDCRPYLNGNNETCTFTPPQTGTYHIMIRGYTAYSGVTLDVSYQ